MNPEFERDSKANVETTSETKIIIFGPTYISCKICPMLKVFNLLCLASNLNPVYGLLQAKNKLPSLSPIAQDVALLSADKVLSSKI